MNAHDRQHVISTFRTIDHRLAEIEAVLLAVGADSPLSAYVMDVGPMERQATAGYIKRIREKMWSAMKLLEVREEGRRTSAAWAIRTTLLGAMIDLVDMEPHRLRGYGEVAPKFAPRLAAVCADLQRLFNSLDAYLRRSQGEDFDQRLARLETAPVTREALATIEAVITRQGLVELRPTLDMILSRLESPEYEIAFFGRVSSGKSSLLNYLLGRDVLPVGVLPVTAVITRLRRAERAGLLVRFEVSPPAALPIEQIPQFVTEEGNPDNRRRVADVEVCLPSPRLKQGVTLIDTPGVGSLATFGAAQTRAYLPRCDLGVLLVDAGASLNHEDLAILEGFHDAAVPAMVLVSKCDLLSEPDRRRVTGYVERHVREALGCELPVHAVSTRGADAALTDRWFDDRIVPLLRDHRANLERSLRRKIANLRETAAAYLAAQLDRADGGLAAGSRHFDAATATRLLESASERIQAMSLKITEPSDKGLAEKVQQLIRHAAIELVERHRRGGRSEVLRDGLLKNLAQEADETRRQVGELGEFLAETVERLAVVAGKPERAARTAAVRAEGDAGPDGDERLSAARSGDLLSPPAPLPQPDEARLRELPQVRRPWWWSLSPALARWMTARAVQRRGQGALWSALSDYRHKLRAWLTVELRRLTDAYESQVAPVRARLAAQEGGDAPPQAANDQLAADVERLRALLPRTEDADRVTPTRIEPDTKLRLPGC